MLKAARRILIVLPLLLGISYLSVMSFVPSSGMTIVASAPVPTPDTPAFNSYKGVAIGMSLEDVRSKLGNPKEPSDTMDYYAPSENEFIQVYYEGKKVTALTVTFSGKLDAAPDAKTVFGESPEVKPDGGIFKMVRYPKAGFWISYNKIIGSDPMVMIAMKKL